MSNNQLLKKAKLLLDFMKTPSGPTSDPMTHALKKQSMLLNNGQWLIEQLTEALQASEEELRFYRGHASFPQDE